MTLYPYRSGSSVQVAGVLAIAATVLALERTMSARRYVDVLCVVAGADAQLALAKVERILQCIDNKFDNDIDCNIETAPFCNFNNLPLLPDNMGLLRNSGRLLYEGAYDCV